MNAAYYPHRLPASSSQYIEHSKGYIICLAWIWSVTPTLDTIPLASDAPSYALSLSICPSQTSPWLHFKLHSVSVSLVFDSYALPCLLFLSLSPTTALVNHGFQFSNWFLSIHVPWGHTKQKQRSTSLIQNHWTVALIHVAHDTIISILWRALK